MLKVNNLNVHYGVINAVKNVTFDVNEGEIVALIGANGAGKTSIMHALSGLLKSTTGDIFFMDKNIKMDIIFQGILILLWAFIGIFYIFADVEIWLKCLWIILSIFWIITGVNKINKLLKSKK